MVIGIERLFHHASASPPRRNGDPEQNRSSGSTWEGLTLLVLVGFGQRDCSGPIPGAALLGRTHSGEWIFRLGLRLAYEQLFQSSEQPL
jgi:hypothetical protein